MPDLISLVVKWRKAILFIVVLSLVMVGAITFLKKQQWLAVATAVPANAFSADRSRIFSENIEALYSNLGTPDDLDMIVGTGQLDTVYLAVTDQFNLFDHYKITEKGEGARSKATRLLKRRSKVMKSEYGELKVKVWDTDKNLAAELANAITEELQSIHKNLQSEGNAATLKSLRSGRVKLEAEIDSIDQVLNKSVAGVAVPERIIEKRKVLNGQLQRYEKLVGEYQLMVDSKPPVLVVVEKAKPSNCPDKPKRIQVMVATGLLSFLFALLLVLVLDRRKLSGS